MYFATSPIVGFVAFDETGQGWRVVASHWQSTDKGTLCTQTCQLLGPPELNTGFAWICHSSPGANSLSMSMNLLTCRWPVQFFAALFQVLRDMYYTPKTVHHHCVQELSCAKSCCTFMVRFFNAGFKWFPMFVCFFSSQWNCTLSRIAILVLTRSMKSEGPLDITRSVLHQKWNILHDGRVKVYWIDSNCVPGPNWRLAAEHVHVYNRVCSPTTIHTRYHLFTNAIKCR